MNLPILRMTDTSFHPAPIVNRSNRWFIDLTAINPFMAAIAPMLSFDDNRAARGAPGAVENRVVVASAFGASHGGLLGVW